MKKPMTFKAKSAFIALAAVVIASGAGAVVSAQNNDGGNSWWGSNDKGTHSSATASSTMNHDDDQMRQNQNDMQGQSSDDMMKDNMNHDDMDYQSVTSWFRDDVRELMNETYQKVGREDGAGLYDFNEAMQKHNAKLDSDMKMAEDMWQEDMDKGMSKDEARNRYMDHFNNAKADYFNHMDMARNQLSRDMDEAGHAAHKDWFINEFNHLRDMYGNKLEMVKNKPHED